MSFKLLSDTCSITRDSSHFVQVKMLKSPHNTDEVWVSLEMEGDHGVARSMFESILNSVEDFYFDGQVTDAYERFESTLREINEVYSALKKKKGPNTIKKINALVAVFSDNQLLITQSNEAEAYLIRKGRVSMITEGLGGRGQELFLNIASGELMPEDKIILSTSRLLRMVTRNQLADLCKEGVTESIDALREVIMGENEFSVGMALLHLKLNRGIEALTKPNKTNAMSILKEYAEKIMTAFDKKETKSEKPVNKSLILVVIILFLALFAFSIYFLGNRNRERELREEYRGRITNINSELNKAEVEGYSGDKETANAILDRIEEDANVVLESNYFTQEVMGLLEKAEKIRDTINGTLRVGEIEPYVDLTEKNPNASTRGLINLNDSSFAFEGNQLYEVVVDQAFDPQPLDQNEIAISAAPLQDQGLIVFLTESGKIMEYNDGEVRFASTTDETWKPASDIASYGRNIYLLSPKDQQIYKYTRQRSDYNGSSEYATDADLEGIKALAIDGSIYVLKEGGEIIKLFKGKQEPFAIEDLPMDLSTANDIYTAEELGNLYILDSAGQRVIIAKKEVGAGAKYEKEIYFENLPEVKSIYVPEEEREMFLLTEKEIYRVEI